MDKEMMAYLEEALYFAAASGYDDEESIRESFAEQFEDEAPEL